MAAMQRRELIAASASGLALGAVMSGANMKPNIKFGVDLFSIRNAGFSPFEYLDYCAGLGAEVVHFSEIRFLGGLEHEHLKRVRAHAEKRGIAMEIGMLSICESSKRFDPKQGTAVEQLGRVVEAARVAGSKLVRCVLGSLDDRMSGVPLEKHIENCVKTLRAVRTRAQDANLKIAVENHAGDLQARELKVLIEEAGKDTVGACLDSGNPVWALEDPHLTLETLAPYVLTSHVRDSYIWRDEKGIQVQWMRMGDGNIRIAEWVKQYCRLCPGKALSMEIICIPSRAFRVNDAAFWDAYKAMPAWEFARFMSYAEKANPLPPFVMPAKEQQAVSQKADLEASTAFTKKVLAEV
jgi:3-oxoisoapionate decarboxylase